jgi:UDP-N-acetylmuramate--alanine ligase
MQSDAGGYNYGTVCMSIGLTQPYLIGIGGCGMSALARLLAEDGAAVSGSDMKQTTVTNALQDAGISVGFDQAAEAIPDAIDGVIVSAAIKPEHPQYLRAIELGVPVYTYAEALGKCMAGRTGVSIAGTHGKSTTTAMLGCVLADAGLDPGVIVGASCAQLAHGSIGTTANPAPQKTGFRLGARTVSGGTYAGKPGFLLAEACEFNRSFHHHRPVIGAIMNVEADHLDIYGSLDEVVRAFAGFAALLPDQAAGGLLLIGHDGAHRREITAGLRCKVETIGYSPAADWTITHDITSGLATLQGPDGVTATWTNTMPGEHNAMNAAVAAALAISFGADPATVGRSLSAFKGLDRRLQDLGERTLPTGGNVRIFDDYGHHPTEVEATLRSLRQSIIGSDTDRRLVCVFQPHQHSRTRFLLDEFATSFEQADVVIVPHIYFVRDSEAEKQKVSAADLVDRLRERGVRAMHLYPFGAIVDHLEHACRDGDVLVVMGAGPVWEVARDFRKTAGSTDSAAAG